MSTVHTQGTDCGQLVHPLQFIAPRITIPVSPFGSVLLLPQPQPSRQGTSFSLDRHLSRRRGKHEEEKKNAKGKQIKNKQATFTIFYKPHTIDDRNERLCTLFSKPHPTRSVASLINFKDGYKHGGRWACPSRRRLSRPSKP